MVWCVAIGCKNSSADRKKRGVSFHRFPKAKGLQKRWVAALKLKRLPERYAETGYVCSEHFVESDFKRDLRAELMGTPLRRTLVEEAVPSVFSFKKVSRRKPPSASREHSRVSTCTVCFASLIAFELLWQVSLGKQAAYAFFGLISSADIEGSARRVIFTRLGV